MTGGWGVEMTAAGESAKHFSMPQPLRILATSPLILAGRNKTYKVGPDPAMKEQWASFMTDFGKIDGQVGFNAYGVCHSFGNDLMDYMCAVEVKDAGQVPGYMYTLTIPSRRTAVFLHEGRWKKPPKPG